MGNPIEKKNIVNLMSPDILSTKCQNLTAFPTKLQK